MSEKASTWNKWAKAAARLKRQLNKGAAKGGLASADKPKTAQERRAEADKQPAPTNQGGVYR